jgi:sensor histidine kinase YesM
MMVQPFVENAIWHGLLKKKGDKHVEITFALTNAIYLQCTISDNGIGRKNKEPALPVKDAEESEKKSLATAFVMQRIHLLNKLYQMDCSLTIEDKQDHQGTIVTIILPILKKTTHDTALNYN